MPATICPYCKALTSMDYVYGTARFTKTPPRIEGVYQCGNTDCLRLLIGGMLPVDFHMIFDDGGAENRLQSPNGQPLYWEPKSVGGKSFPDVPTKIAAVANEAHECFSIGAYKAAVVLARAVIEGSAKDKQVTEGDLFTKIKTLADQGLIREKLAEAAHSVRLDGNNVAHGDLDMVHTQEDAEDVLDLMDTFLAELYEIDAVVARRGARRTTNKSATGG